MAQSISTSHGHIGAPGQEYRISAIRTRVSETNPQLLLPGQSKTSTVTFRSPSFTTPQGYTKVNDDQLIVYSGLAFDGELEG